MTRHGFQDMPLAIIGMACRLPDAENLEEYWGLLRDAGCAIRELPPHRFDAGLYYHPDKGVPGKSYSKLGGLVPERPFDRRMCPIPDALIDSSDVLHLTMLEVAAAACRHAGLDPLALPLRNTGVFIGHTRGGTLSGDIAYSTHIEQIVRYLKDVDAFAELSGDLRDQVVHDVVERVHRQKPYRMVGRNPDVAPNAVASLISEAFGLTGPYMAVDAACASSLLAMALAAHALHHGRIDMAVVGGATYSNWYSLVIFSQAQAISAAGSFPFDARADGFISSDGYAAVLVKTLPRALADGDTVYGVIQGIGISSDGHGKSLWAPRKEGQVEAIRRAYAQGQDPARVQYIEAHGTSTQLGDATELEALAATLGDRLPPGTRIPIGSVKANIGHTRETAGLASLIKTLLAMQHGIIPPAANFETPNPHIPWDQLPFVVPTEALEWAPPKDGHPRRAAIDAFGIGGLNAHVVVDQFSAEARAVRPMPATPPDGQGGRDRSGAEDDAIAIIGCGAIFPGARTVAGYWDLLVSGRDPKRDVPSDRWDPGIFLQPGVVGPWRSPTGVGGFITDFAYDWKKHRIPPKQIETADPLQFMLLDAADQALRDAGYDNKTYDRRRTGVVVGTIFGGDFAGQLNRALRLPDFQRALTEVLLERDVPAEYARAVCDRFAAVFGAHHQAIYDETGSYTTSTLASRIAKTLDLLGGAFALDAAEASSLAAVGTAVDLLLSDACDMVLCAGAQRAMDITVYEALAMRGVLCLDHPRAAFDAAAKGFVPGEGTGLVILKRLRDARRDGDRIRAVIRGTGMATDTVSPGVAMRSAMERALAQSGIDPRDVAVVETAGTGVARLDAEEAEALARLYGSQPRQHPLFLGSVAGQIGHTLGASGMASLLKLLLALEHRQMPASVGFVKPADSVADHRSILRLLPEASAIPAPSEGGSVLAGLSAFALRGSAYHLILERPPDATGASAAVPRDWRIVRLGAGTMAELVEQAARRRDDAESLFPVSRTTGFTARDRARLAIVADSAVMLGERLGLASEQLARPGARPVLEEQGVFCRTVHDGSPRVAFLFSGQGSQYDGMLRALVDEAPAAAAMRREIDATLSRLGYQTFAEVAWGDASKLGNDVWLTQLSVLLADLIVHAAVTSTGIRPDIISGHSFGEYPALVAAGAWTLEQAIRVTRARCEAIEASEQAQGVMLSTTAPPEVVERLAAGIRGVVCVANHNAPDQTVVGGQPAAVSELETRLASEGFERLALAVPRPFHTPLMAQVKEPLRLILDKERILPPRVPFMSSVTNRYVSDPLDLRANLVEQLTTPVRYVDLIARLAEEGVTAFVEVGPRQVLTRLHRRILAERDAAIIACDNPKRPGMEHLACVQALLACAGVPMGLARADDPGLSRGPVVVPARTGITAEIIHFDATARRRQKMRRSAELVPEVASRRAASPAGPADELESFLVTFICEQTGYPPEIVDLDADLEADLGIDSIKKARLLGELRERFAIPIEPTNRLSLDDYPTLRHVLNFLRDAAGGTGLRLPVDPPASRAETARTGAVAGTARGTAPDATTSSDGLIVLRCAGTPYEMGVQHALGQAKQIENILKRYYKDLLGGEFAEMSDLQEALAHADIYLTSAGVEELRGIADGLEMPVDYLIAYNLGLYPAQAAGCTQFAITARRNGAVGMIHGANEDSPLSLSLPDCLTRIVQARHPSAGIPHVTFGVPGQLGGLSGINSRGVAVTSTMLLDRQRAGAIAPGTIHPVLVKAILEGAEDIEGAVEIVRRATRVGAWSLCISHHAIDRLCYLEYDGVSLEVQHGREAAMSTNHCLLHPPVVEPFEHSRHRLTRLHELLGENGQAGYTVAQAQAALRDRYDVGRQRETPHPTMNTIRRIDNHVSIVMRPALGEVWATPGPLAADRADRYYRLDLAEIFASGPPPARPARERAGPATAGSSAATSPDVDEAPSDEDGRIMRRFVLRMVDAPLDRAAADTPRLHGPALILGENSTARALRERLEGLGATVLNLPVSEDPEEALAALTRCWEAQPIPHLFLLTARDEGAAWTTDEAGWARRPSGLLLPYLVCQRWTRLVTELNLLDKATLVAATALGGDFGLSGGAAAAEGGGLAGLLKGIRHEFDGMLVKVIDAPPQESPKGVAAAICSELAAGTAEVEVGYVRGRRRVIRAAPRRTMPVDGGDIPHGGTWVVTGGARGITAFVARELGQRFGLTLHLIGKSSAPQIDDGWRNLSETQLRRLKLSLAQEAHQAGRDPSAAWGEVEKALEIDVTLRGFAAEGVRATYHSCDVADREALARVLDRIRQADGPIRGIIHGAGVESAARFERKKLEGVMATIAAKIDGAANLMALTREDPLAYFVAFGSITGRFGGHGQTDYSSASDMLCKLIGRFRTERPACASAAMHWPPWGEVGMAVRPETKVVLEAAGQRYMPPREGVAHLIDELRAGAPEAEVLLIDRQSRLDLDRITPTPAQWQAYTRRGELIRNAPLIDGVHEVREGHSLVAEARLDPTSDPFLRDHRFQGVPLLPAVIGIEALAEAASILAARPATGLRRVEIVNAFRFHADRPQDARVRAAATDQGIHCELSGDFYNRHGKLIDPQRVSVTGIVDTAEWPMAAAVRQPDAKPDTWYEMQYPDEGRARDEGLMYHGPSLRCLRQVSLRADGGWGRIIAPPSTELGGRRGPAWIVGAAALDACLVACGVFASKVLKAYQLPQAFERLRLGRLPRAGETCTVHLTFRGRQDQSTCFDFMLFGEDGAAIFHAEGHRCITLARNVT